MLLHEEVDDSGFVSLSRLGPCLKDKDLEMEALMLQDETLLGTMQSYMDASLISLIEDFGSLGEVSWSWAWRGLQAGALHGRLWFSGSVLPEPWLLDT